MRMDRVLRGLLLVGIVGGSTAAIAQRRPKDFQPSQITEEQIEAAKEHSKYKYTPYTKDAPQQAEPFPWLAVGMALIALGGTAPFAYRYYRNTSAEVIASKTFGTRAEADSDADA
jgi:hypothetical protein